MNEFLRYYLGPTGIPDKLNALAQIVPMIADGQDYVDYYQSGGRTMNALANRDLWGTVGGIGDMASAGAAMMLPGVTARAMREGVDVAGDLARFAGDESGALRLGDDIEARGAQIMDMLRGGRGAEVTDAMLDMGDPVKNARLNDYLFRNYDLPMDTASRMERAQGMGHRLNIPLFHGGADDVQAFNQVSSGATSNSRAAQEASVWAAERPHVAGEFANLAAQGNGRTGQNGHTGQVVYPLVHRTNNPASLALDGTETNLEIAGTLHDAFSVGGQDAVRMSNYTTPSGAEGGNIFAIKAPEQVRSRFARFDPRLSHLRDLSAGVAGAAMIGGQGQEQDDPAAQIRAYLAQFGLE